MKERKSGLPKRKKDEGPITRNEILTKSPSEYEALVAIAREARRLNSAPEVFLKDGERAIPKALENFVQGKIQYEIEEKSRPKKKSGKEGRKAK